MKIVFFGTPSFVLPVLEVLNKHFALVGVVTTPDVPVGRKKIITPTPVKQFARDKKISGITTDQQWNNETIEQLKRLQPDLFVVAAYGQLIPRQVLDIPKFGTLNIHPSLLPKYRGPSPIQTALYNGDEKTGITIMKMDEKLDHGPILTQWELPIDKNDTFQTLHQKMFRNASEKLPKVIKHYVSGVLHPKHQDDTKAVYCKKITKQDGYFDLENPPTKEKLDRMIRAFYPWPTAWTKIRIKNQEVRIKVLPEKKLQVEGGKVMTLKDFMNGYPELRETVEKLL